MAVTHTTAVRDSITDLVVGNLNNGVLRYQTSADVTVADGTLSATAYGASSGGTATANPIGNATNNTGSQQVVAKAVQRSTTTDIVFCSVSLPLQGGDIEMTNTTVANTEEIITSSLTYTAPA